MILTLAIIITLLGILYIISPLDFVPDFIPIIGWADDLIVAILIGLTWLVYFGILVLSLFFKSIFPILIIVAIIVMFIKLLQFLSKPKKKK